MSKILQNKYSWKSNGCSILLPVLKYFEIFPNFFLKILFDSPIPIPLGVLVFKDQERQPT